MIERRINAPVVSPQNFLSESKRGRQKRIGQQQTLSEFDGEQ